MKRIYKFVFLAILLGLILAGLIIYMRGGRIVYDAARLVDLLPDNVDMQLTGVDYSEVTEKGREWTMKAKTLHYFQAQDLTVLDDVRATFHGQDGPMQISGEKAYYEKKAQRIRMVGHVKALDSKGRSLVTEEVSYHLGSGLMIAPGWFELTGPQLDLKGVGLNVDTQKDLVKVLNQVNVVVKSMMSQN